MGATIDDELDDHPSIRRPYSHAAAYDAIDRIALVAAADIDAAHRQAALDRYDIPNGYQDYRTMIETEDPDIVSVATGPATHEEMVGFAARAGTPAIYCEKPLCQSMEEAEAMLRACDEHGVQFNLSVLRRFMTPYKRIRQALDEGEIGEVNAVIQQTGSKSLLWGHSHTADMLLYLRGDLDVRWVQADVDMDPADVEDGQLLGDPRLASATVRYTDGGYGYLTSATGWEVEIDGEQGRIRSVNDGERIRMRREGGTWGEVTEDLCPDHQSATVACIEELIDALDGRGSTTAPIEAAVRGQELLMGWVASERRNGQRVALPLDGEDRTFKVVRG
jgi:predicted dehydrogenase